MPRKLFLFVLFILIPLTVAFAQSEPPQREDIWICPGGEMAFYSVSGPAWGGGLAFGYGSGTSIGLKANWFICPDGINTLELNFLFRIYFLGSSAFSGPFIQITGGPAFFTNTGGVDVPSEFGMISAGLGLGWRFILGNLFFIEPSIRGGYPYILGAGLSAGIRF